MSIYSRPRRFLKAVVTTMMLVVVYLVVRAVTTPVLEVGHKPITTIANERVVVPEIQQDIADWFKNVTWVHSAANYFRDQGRYLFCEKIALRDDDHRVVVSPIAMLWRAEDADETDVPITVTADSAQLIGTERFISGTGEFGRIQAGSLNGRIRIDGPQGLKIEGQSFRLVEESTRVISDNTVRFEWNGHTGYAEKGIEIHLSADASRAGFEDINNVEEIRLLGRVICNITIPGQRVGEEAQEFRIRAPQGFTFNMLTNEGLFRGFETSLSARLDPRSDVLVERKVGDEWPDKLLCPELKFSLRRDLVGIDGQTQSNDLHLAHVIAWGRRVLFHSSLRQVLLDANRIQYFVPERRMEFSRSTALNGQPGLISLRRGTTELRVPQVEVLHDENGEIQRIQCNGQGSIDAELNKDESNKSRGRKPMELFARWKKQMSIQVAEDGLTRILRLDQDAVIGDRLQKALLGGQFIMARLVSDVDKKPNQTANTEIANADFSKELDLSTLRPILVTAVDDVSVHSKQGHGKVRERLTLNFEDSPVNPIRTVSSSSTSFPTISNAAHTATPRKTRHELDKDSDDQVNFVSDSLTAVVKTVGGKKPKFHDVWLNGNVSVTRTDLVKPGQSFTATGNKLFAQNGLKDRRTIQLFGDPAHVKSSTGNVTGKRIDFQELGQKADVHGSGRIRFITDRGLDGKPLPEPIPIEIFWSERMQFQSEKANFFGDIRVVMDDKQSQKLELTCTGLTVEFDGDVDVGSPDRQGRFSAATFDPTGKGDARLKHIKCHNKVIVRIEQQENGTIIGRHSAEVADLKADLDTGDFSAIGWGQLISVSPDEDGQLQGGTPASARANAPAQASQSAFVSMKIEFIGKLLGNLHRKEATVTQNVVASVAPAQHIDDIVEITTLPIDQMPKEAGILQAETITVSEVKLPDGVNSFALDARQNARLESKSLSGRADVITYDHAKQQFIIRAEGDGLVSVTQRKGALGKYQRATGNRFEYYRRTNDLKGNKILGLHW